MPQDSTQRKATLRISKPVPTCESHSNSEDDDYHYISDSHSNNSGQEGFAYSSSYDCAFNENFDLNSEARDYYNSRAHKLVTAVRGDGYGGGGYNRGGGAAKNNSNGVQSHNYEPDESEVWRAYVAQQHYSNRGQWWTTGTLRDHCR